MTTTFEVRVAASADDCRLLDSGSQCITNTSEEGWSYNNPGYFYSGMRFLNVTVPKLATISTSYITFVPDYAGASNVIAYIYIEDTHVPATYSTYSDFNARTWWATYVSWNTPTLVLSTPYNTPSINTLIQHIVNRSDWVSGNNISIKIAGISGNTCPSAAISYDGSTTLCPKLHIEYTPYGWANIKYINGATATDLAKVNGIAVADIAKLNGVAV